ncbi:MAG: ABC transporter permease [Solirubrobacteraceae bacterium]|jgi:ABC-type nitrate/sulfonate/bicarbonate transport system permease component
MNRPGSTTALVLAGRLEPRSIESFDARRLLRRVAPPLVFALLVLGVWQLYVVLAAVSESVLPSPVEVARTLVDDRGVLAPSAWTTLSEILIGYGVAIVVGVALALAVSSSSLVERAAYPWLVISQLIPVPAIAALVVVWSGFGISSKVIVIALVSFFPIAVNTIDGLRSTEPELLDLLATLGAGRTQQLRLARAPSALPYLFSGLRVAAVLSVIGAVFAEWVGSYSTGLGSLILIYNNETATAAEFATIVVLACIGIVLFAAVGLAERTALPWYRLPRAVPAARH